MYMYIYIYIYIYIPCIYYYFFIIIYLFVIYIYIPIIIILLLLFIIFNVYVFKYINIYIYIFEKRVPLPDNRNDQWPVEGYGSAHQGYPKQGVRRYSQHPSSPFYAPRIVTIIGPRLPNRDTLATSKQARALYGLMILVLFSPFRDVNDLAQPFHDTDEESK